VRALTLEELLLELGLGDLDLDSLVDLLCVTAAVVGVVLDGGGEKGVDEGGLAEARLAGNHDGEGSTALRDNLVALVRELHGISKLSDASIVAVGNTHVGNANWRHSFGHCVYEWSAADSSAGVPGRRWSSFDDLECYAAQAGRRMVDVGDVFTDKRYKTVFEGVGIVVCWSGDVSGSFRGGRGGGEVVVGTGKGLHVRPSSPGATRVLIVEAAWMVGVGDVPLSECDATDQQLVSDTNHCNT
jgi:hypothetical protein